MSEKKFPSTWAEGGRNSMENPNFQQHQTTSASACSEKLVDGKLSLHMNMSASETEPLHTGKWSEEEMAYAEGLIDEFKAGNLALPDGTSLRQFLAKMLNCSPKRISKRYEGNNYSKGRKFYVKSTEKLDPLEAQSRRKRLNDLERKYKQKLMHLKMPHLLLANRTADWQPQEEQPQKGPAVGNLATVSNELSLGTAVPGQATVGLSASIADTTLRAPTHNDLRMDQASVLQSGLASNPSVQLSNPSPAGPAAGLTDINTLSRLADDAGTLALLTQVSSQRRDSQRLSAILEAQRRINNNTVLGGNTFGVHQDLLRGSPLGTSSLLGDLRASSSLLGDLSSLQPRQQSLEAALSQQQRLQQLARAEQLLSSASGQQSSALPYGTSLSSQLQANVGASLPSSTLGTHPLTLLPPPAATLQPSPATSSSPSDQLHSLLQIKSQAGSGTNQALITAGRGQKRRASETEDISNSSSNSGSRRRLAGSGNSVLGWDLSGRGPNL